MTPQDQEYRKIPLTKGLVSLVSVEDFDLYGKFKWSARWDDHVKGFRAVRWLPRGDGTRKMLYLHREILGLKPGDGIISDHSMHDTLDNRLFVKGKANLRRATSEENMRNMRRNKNNSSGYKCVSFHKRVGKWQAYIMGDKKRKYLGYFPSKEEARLAYQKAASSLFGEFACFE